MKTYPTPSQMIYMVSEHSTYFISREITRSCFTLQLRSDGIIQMNIADDAYFTLNESKEYVDALKELTRGVPHPVLKIEGSHSSMDNEARTYLSSDEVLQYALAEGVIIRNLAQRILASFYIKFDKPAKPVRLFTRIPEAENWLRKHI